MAYLCSYSKEVASILSSVKDKNPDEALEYLENHINTSQKVQDQRDLLIFKASLQERSGFYELAAKTYEKAAAIQPPDDSEPSASLLIQAARCALSHGDFQLADTYLSIVSRTALSSELAAKIKLYAVWSWLSKINDEDSLHEPLVILASYIDMKGMETVQASILLTLWYLSGDDVYSKLLTEKYPNSVEAAIIQGRVQLMPTPFWYFRPRKTRDTVLDSTAELSTTISGDGEKSEAKSFIRQDEQKEAEKYDESAASILHYQLGFFRNNENALDLVQRLQKAGFSPSIQEEKRQSGTTYYAVIVKENDTNTMGSLLKNAGFECYPVFK